MKEIKKKKKKETCRGRFSSHSCILLRKAHIWKMYIINPYHTRHVSEQLEPVNVIH